MAEKLVTLGKRAQAALGAASSTSDPKAKAAAVAENVHCRRLAAASCASRRVLTLSGLPKVRGRCCASNGVRRMTWCTSCATTSPRIRDRNGGYTGSFRSGSATAMRRDRDFWSGLKPVGECRGRRCDHR